MGNPRMPPVQHRAYMLRTCNADMTAHGGFVWPRRGYVEAPDWSSEPKCGGGLHGLLGGEGDYSRLFDGRDMDTAVWLAVCVDARQVVEIDRKIKVPRGWVLVAGDRAEAVAEMQRHGCDQCYASIVTGGNRSTVTGGYASTVTIRWWDGARYRLCVGYVGEDGIEANVPYRCECGKLVPAEAK